MEEGRPIFNVDSTILQAGILGLIMRSLHQHHRCSLCFLIQCAQASSLAFPSVMDCDPSTGDSEQTLPAFKLLLSCIFITATIKVTDTEDKRELPILGIISLGHRRYMYTVNPRFYK